MRRAIRCEHGYLEDSGLCPECGGFVEEIELLDEELDLESMKRSSESDTHVELLLSNGASVGEEFAILRRLRKTEPDFWIDRLNRVRVGEGRS